MTVPEELKCPVCGTLLKNAVELPCCRTCICRGCAIKKLMVSKKTCWIKSSPECEENKVQLDQLTPAEDARRLVEDFKGGGTLYKDKSVEKEPEEIEEEQKVEDEAMETETPIFLDPTIVVKKEPGVESEENCGDDELSAKIAQKSAELRARLEKCKISSNAQTETVEETLAAEASLEAPVTTKASLEAPVTAKASLEAPVTAKACVEAPADATVETIPVIVDNQKEKVRNDPVMDTQENQGSDEECEEYGEGPSIPIAPEVQKNICEASHRADLSNIKTENFMDLNMGHSSIKTETFIEGLILPNCPTLLSAPNSVESVESSAAGGHLSPKKEPGLCTPTSSGYWSDDMKEGPYFGKLKWHSDRKSEGHVEIVLDKCESRRVPVSGFDVKCGAETGDLVEFVLGADTVPDSDGRLVRPAKKVKLVEKGLPVSEAEQIRGQVTLKRSLEFSAGLLEDEGGLSKKIKTESEDTVIDVRRAGINSFSDFSDIAEEDDEDNVTTERDYDDLEDEELYDHCICDQRLMVRCQLCPFYFLEARISHCLLEGESVTILAKVNGNEGELKQDLTYVRHLPFPFKFLNQPSFDLLRILGRKSLVTKVSPVFYQDHVFITLTNLGKKQVTINPGDILGICQAHQVSRTEVSEHFVCEPHNRQTDHKRIPLFASKDDFSTDERRTVCGFGSLGKGDLNYKHCLVKLELVPDMARKFRLHKSEVTVQIKQNVWLELEPRKMGMSMKGFERSIPSDGCIGFASSILVNDTVMDHVKKLAEEKTRMHQKWLEQHNVNGDDGNIDKQEEETKKIADQNSYEEMLTQIDLDMKVNDVNSSSSKLKADESLLSRVFRGVVRENLLIIPPGGQVETNLFLCDEDDLCLKSLLKFKAKVTNNEEFKYYNNCYNIPEQVVTIVNGVCRINKTTKPCIKVNISNPRRENAILKKESPIALVKVHIEENSPSKNKPVTVTKEPSIVAPPKVEPKPVAPLNMKPFDPVKHIDKMERRCTRKWDQIINEKTFEKSLEVEEKYPYFNKNRPKIPFGLKDKELNLRFGVNQDSRPVKILDKVNGVFACTICDRFVVLDRYSLQDHWYSAKHKRNMRLVQVIAGLQERLFMDRPVVVEQLEQFTLAPLLGLDHLVEVLRGKQEPLYNCAICNIDSSLKDLILHFTSVKHNLAFLKEFFPVAWARFSSNPDPSTWSMADFMCLDQVVLKVDSVHGRKKPSIVSGVDKLEECVDKIPLNSYSARRSELDSFFRTLKPPDPVEPPSRPKKVQTTSCPALLKEDIELAPGGTIITELLLGSGSLRGQWVQVGLNPGVVTKVRVQGGLSKVWQEQQPTLRLKLSNPSSTSAVTVTKKTPLVMARWRL